MRKIMMFAAIAAVALGASSAAMAAHGGGGGGHMGGGGGGHMGGGFSAGHFGGGAGFAPHFASVPSGRGVVSAEPHTFSTGRAFAFRGSRDHDRFHHRRFGFDGGLYAYEPSCYYSPYVTWPYYNNCYLDYDQSYE
jgi:hypothetical protein